MKTKLLKFLKKKGNYKLLFIISTILVLLTSSAFALVHYKKLELTQPNSKLIYLDEKTDEEEISEINKQENLTSEKEENSTDPQEEIEDEENQDTDNQEPAEEDEQESNQEQEDENSDDQTNTNEDNDSDTTDSNEDESEPDPEPEPQPESPSVVVAFYADNQSDSDSDDENHQRVVNYILNSGANPVFHAGDVMEDGTQDSLDRFNTVTSTLRSTRTFYAALGNNDRKVGDSSTPSQLFLDNFVFPNNERWYSVNYGNLHMIILDSAFAASSPTQLSWLSSDLQTSNSQDRITGVMFHHPSFSSTISTYLTNYGADFIISGHLHSYNHYLTDGIDQFVLSGQPNIGYMIAKIYSDKVEITVYNNSNSVIDTVTINER
jgi:predicted phosphodiesterase